MIRHHLNSNKFHHAILVEGEREVVIPEILSFVSDMGVQTSGNSDFVQIHLDSFKVEDARNLKALSALRAVSKDATNKKIFLVSANNFLIEAQNSLLKIFEEPVEDTHFFVVVPSLGGIVKTLISRFYVISARQDLATQEAEKFIKMPLPTRINFLKELLSETEEKDEGGEEVVNINSPRKKALDLLNALESTLSKAAFGKSNMSKMIFDTAMFEHFFKVREFLRMPGSSAKTLMESVALIVPKI